MLYKYRCIIMSVLLMCSTLGLWAVPARRVAFTVEQPDGTILALAMRGDEHFHCLVTADGVPVVRYEGAYYYALVGEGGVEPSDLLAHEPSLRSAEERAFVAALPDVASACSAQVEKARARRRVEERQASEVPTTGEVYVPVLLVQYKDVKFSSDNPQTDFEERINGDNYTAEGGYGSIREYFVEQSGGKFTPQFDIIGPITLDRSMEYYGGNDKEGADLRPREMVSEACRKAYSVKGTDFKRYDNNGDGYVDILYVIYAGYGEASYPEKLENTVWPHQWQLEAPLTLGGVKISRYACNNELDGYSGTRLDGIGTFCHEFSHCLGLPDFYDTAGGDAFGMDVWSVMDYGCYNNDGHTPCGYTAYEKDYLGWVSLVELNSPASVALKPLSEGGVGYKIVNDANPDEFYVVEYLDKSGWNKYAPAEGMLVMHVDYLPDAWHENVVNNDPKHPRMTLIPADGKLTSSTLAADVWLGKNGNTSLTATSNPPAKVYTGGYMNKDITDISQSDDGVTFSFMQESLPAPVLHAPVIVSPSAFTLTWDAVEAAEAYDVRLDLIGDDSLEYAIRTVRVDECRYTFSELDGGLYHCRVRSVGNGIGSLYSEAVSVLLIDSLLPSVGAAPRIRINNDSITIEAADSADIYYTLDGSYPTVYSQRYTAPFRTTGKVSVSAIARREGYRSTSVSRFDNWFVQDGATYRITSTTPLRAVVTESAGGKDDEGYCGHYIFGDTVWHADAAYILDGFDAGAFRNATALRSVTVESDVLCTVGDSLFHGCAALNAVVWDVPVALPHEVFDGDSYRNLLVYLPDTMEVPASLTRCAYATLVRDGRSGPLMLDATSAFYCPRTFTAESIAYHRTFGQTTGLGTAGGWETLALPFDVQRITHATKGEITPFGNEGEQHCWLATPREGAFTAATEIRANTPYIIAMPSNTAYGAHSLSGSVTFSAEEALVHATPLPEEAAPHSLAAEESGRRATVVSLALLPNYAPIEASDEVYALNVGAKYSDYAPGNVFAPSSVFAPGSVFAAGRYDVAPFSAYMVVVGTAESAPFYPIAVIPDAHREEEGTDGHGTPHTLAVYSKGGCLYIISPEARTVYLYDAVGRLLRTVACVPGTTEVGPLPEGLYIIDNTKVYVER